MTNATAPVELGRYALLQQIGRGGFGVVYRAFDPRLGREVAAKLLRTRVGRENADALIHEARMAAQLQHPNIIRIFDVGRIEGDWSTYGADVFIVMELLDGLGLHHWLRQKDRSVRSIVEVFVQAAEALAAAHQAGIVHCDVKPANVFVTQADEVKVLDFGLSRYGSTRSRATRRSELLVTDTGNHRVLGGTRPYMAPEAHAGRDPDAAADQYSFAIALVEALTGSLPFADGSRRELVRSKLKGLPRAWLEHQGVPRRLIRVVQRATSPQPEHRYPGMDSLTHDLRRWLHPHPRRWWLVAASVSVLGAMGIPAASQEACALDPDAAADRWRSVRGSIERGGSAPEARPQAFVDAVEDYTARWGSAAARACAATSPAGEDAKACLRERLGRLDAVLSLVASADDTMRPRAAELVAQFVSPGDCLDPARANEVPPMPARAAERVSVTEIRDRLSLARAHHAAGNYAEGLRIAKLGLVEATGGFEPVRAEAMYETGILAVSAGDLEDGADYIEQAYFAAEGQRHDRLAAAAAVRLVSIHGRHLVHGGRARPWARRARVAVERLSGDTKYRAALSYNLGLLEYGAGSPALARGHFEDALELYEERGDARDARICRMSLGAMAKIRGETRVALGLFEDAYAEARTELGLEHPDTAAALTSLAGVQSTLGQLQVARENLQTALEVFERAHGPSHHAVASTLVNIGSVEFDLGNYEQALGHYVRALSIFEAILPPDHPRTAIAIDNIAGANLQIGAYEEARAGHARALDMRREQLGPSSPRLALHHARLGLALAHLGRRAEAEAEFEAATILLRGTTMDAELARVELARAVARRLAGQRPVDDVRRAIAGFEREDTRPELAEAKFELAQALLETDPEGARAAARESLAAFRSMGARARAAPIQAWLEAHAEQ